MKKLLYLLLFISTGAFAQSTTTLPTPTTAYTPQFRYYGGSADSLKQIWVYSGGKYNRWYTATEIIKLFGRSFNQKIDSIKSANNTWTGNNYFANDITGGTGFSNSWTINVNPTFGRIRLISDGQNEGNFKSGIIFNWDSATPKSLIYSPGIYGNQRLHFGTDILAYIGDVNNTSNAKIDSLKSSNNNWTGANTFSNLQIIPDGLGNSSIYFKNPNGTMSTLYYGAGTANNNGYLDWRGDYFQGKNITASNSVYIDNGSTRFYTLDQTGLKRQSDGKYALFSGAAGSDTSVSNNYVAKMPNKFGANVTGTAGNGFIQLPSQSVSPASSTGNLRIYSDSLNRLSWKNSQHRRTIRVARLSDQTITMPYRLNPTVADSTDVDNNYQAKVYAIPSRYPGANDAAKVQAAINSGLPVWLEKRYDVSAATLIANKDSVSISTAKGVGSLYSNTNAPIFNTNGKSAVTIEYVTFYGSGKSSGNTLQQGIEITGTANNTKVIGCEFVNIGGYAIRTHDRTDNRATGLLGSDIKILNSYGGLYCFNQSEYNSITGIYAQNNGTGFKNFAGNNSITGGQMVQQDTAVYLGAGTNNAHSGITNVAINHSTAFNVYADGVTLNYNFVNCPMYFGNIYINNSNGILFDQGLFGGAFTLTVNNSTDTRFQYPNFLSLFTLVNTGNKPIFIEPRGTYPTSITDAGTYNNYANSRNAGFGDTRIGDIFGRSPGYAFGIKSTTSNALLGIDGLNGSEIRMGYNGTAAFAMSLNSTTINLASVNAAYNLLFNINGNFLGLNADGSSGKNATNLSFWDFKAATTAYASGRMPQATAVPTTRRAGDLYFWTDNHFHTYTTTDQSFAYLSDFTTAGTINNKVLAPNNIYQSSTGTTADSLAFVSSQKHVSKALVAGSGIGITQTASTVTIAAQTNVVEITGTSQTAAGNTIYIPHNASLTTITVPATTTIGTLYQVVGEGSGGWRLSLPAGYVAVGVGSFTTTSGGSLNSTDRNCTLTIRLTAPNKFTVTTSQGTINPL